MNSPEEEIRQILSGVKELNQLTIKTENLVEIGYFENPLNPSLLAYCFDVILGFDVKYRIAEKVNYIIEFDYKGTYAKVGHYKLSYRLFIDQEFRSEIIAVFDKIKPLLEQDFLSRGEKAFLSNQFTMVNETPNYFEKLRFYEERIESLKERHDIIREKTKGQCNTVKVGKVTHSTPKCQDYLRRMNNEMIYDIDAYIDSFFSALEHVLTLLYPFTPAFPSSKSYYKAYIQNTKWIWTRKIKDVFGERIPDSLIDDLKRIKEVYRNHHTHGGFSREMMAYVQIPSFGRYPMYIGKEYLKGFIDGIQNEITYKTYRMAKTVFSAFWELLHREFTLPMMFVESGLPIPVETNTYTRNITSEQEAQFRIEELLYDIDNQYNMDW